MAHLRSQIFDKIVTSLREISEFSAAGKVERTRRSVVPDHALPAITVTWADDDEQSGFRPFSNTDGGVGYDRSIPVSIIVHMQSGGMDVDFDVYAEEIEKRMAADATLSGLAVEVELISSRYFVDRQTGVPMHAGRLIYRVHYKSQSDPALVAL